MKFFCRETGKRIDGFSDDALEVLVDYAWPGNVRQVRNVVERLVIMADGRILGHSQLTEHWQSDRPASQEPVPTTLEGLKQVKQRLLQEQFGQVEKAFLRQALAAAEGNITQAARQVGMQRSNFSALMKRHALSADSTTDGSGAQAARS